MEFAVERQRKEQFSLLGIGKCFFKEEVFELDLDH
jgi:hypothetical protein